MSGTITPVTLSSGRNGNHRESYCQVNDTGIQTNGHDDVLAHNIRRGTATVMGIVAPSVAPAVATNGAGNVNGSVQYRVRWRDGDLNVYSLPSAAVSIAATSNTIRITKPLGTAPAARVTHWVIERTKDSGVTWYPVNMDTSNPDGTLLATTTYDDSISDQTIGGRFVIPSNQGTPTYPMRVCFANRGLVFMLGGRVHRTTATLTGVSVTVTGVTGANAAMIGQDLSVPADADGKMYKIANVVGTTITLAVVYAGSNGVKTVAIAGPRDRVIFTEPGYPEHCGEVIVGGLRNEVRIGDDGEPLIGGCGLGPAGVLYAKESSLYFHSYSVKPNGPPISDGRISKLATRRGLLGPLALRFIDGYVYGMDGLGIWRASPGGEPQEIGQRLANEWKNGGINFKKGDNFLIGWDPFNRKLHFFVCEGSDTYPKKSYIYDLQSNEWVGSYTWPLGVTCVAELPDSGGVPRMCYWLESTAGVDCFFWMHGLADSAGADPSSTPLNGTITSSASTSTFSNSGAAFTTTNAKLKGCAATKITAAGVEETRIISDNTATQITVGTAYSVQPAIGDTYRIAPIEAQILTPRMFMESIDRKKKFNTVCILVLYKAACTPLYVRAYYDGSATAETDQVATLNEDGVLHTLNTAPSKIDPTSASVHRFFVPLGGKWATDLQLELYSKEAGVPWEIMGVQVDYEFDQAKEPRKK